MLEDKLLIWKYNRGRTEILHRIYEKYKQDLLTLATALLNDKHTAEDVVQDVFTNLINSCGKLQIKTNLKGYLATSIANKVRDRLRTNRKLKNVPLDLAESTTSQTTTATPHEPLWFEETVKPLARALETIPPEQREVIMLRLYSSLTFKAIAQNQNQSINTIQGRYRYGLTKLRSLLNGEIE
ncbi:MAG: sigma-70 family RNA polymerase sigma factor [Planctomycetes bacterium]|nr:sigma-70 family RNA polymerase sigma factor [Planctomycetota bacterium]